MREKMKTLLVETGQIDTGLFSGVEVPWYAQFFAPILEAKDVARRIVDVVGRGEGRTLRMPVYAVLVGCGWGMVPGSVRRLVRWGSGVDEAAGGMRREGKKG